MTVRANKSRLVHSRKEVGDNRGVARLVKVPTGLSELFQRLAVVNHLIGGVGDGGIRLLANATQILGQGIQKEHHKFLTVVLIITGKLRALSASRTTELSGADIVGGRIWVVKIRKQSGPIFCNISTAPKLVAGIEFGFEFATCGLN